jgi:hypothetical protein
VDRGRSDSRSCWSRRSQDGGGSRRVSRDDSPLGHGWVTRLYIRHSGDSGDPSVTLRCLFFRPDVASDSMTLAQWAEPSRAREPDNRWAGSPTWSRDGCRRSRLSGGERDSREHSTQQLSFHPFAHLKLSSTKLAGPSGIRHMAPEGCGAPRRIIEQSPPMDRDRRGALRVETGRLTRADRFASGQMLRWGCPSARGGPSAPASTAA